jgi:serine/threonine protein kinase
MAKVDGATLHALTAEAICDVLVGQLGCTPCFHGVTQTIGLNHDEVDALHREIPSECEAGKRKDQGFCKDAVASDPYGEDDSFNDEDDAIIPQGPDFHKNIVMHDSSQALCDADEDPRNTNRAYFHSFAKFEPFPSGSLAQVSKLATGLNGDIFKFTYERESVGETVAVKVLGTQQLLSSSRPSLLSEKHLHFEKGHAPVCPDDALTEIGILSLLARRADLPIFLLKMLGAFTDDKSTWLVTEFADGGELFNLAAAGSVSDGQIRQHAWEILQAVSYLHCLHIGHRDLSLENILIKDGVVRVIDFGMAVRTHTASGEPLRYFRAVGKSFYRAPECYVPAVPEVSVVVPFGGTPDTVAPVVVENTYWCEVRLPANSIPSKVCTAEVWGYTVPRADVFSLGVCFFILAWQCPPWEKTVLTDPGFSYIWRHKSAGIRMLLQHWRKELRSEGLLRLVSEMLLPDPTQRPHAATCLGNSYFAPLASTIVRIHA